MENKILPKIDKEKILENFRKRVEQAKLEPKAQPKKVELSSIMPEVNEEAKAKVREMLENMKAKQKQPVKQMTPEEMEQAKEKMREAMEKFKERFKK